MTKPAALLALALAAGALAAAPAQAAEPTATFTVTNDAGRIAICTIVVDGRSETNLKIRPGKTHAADYGARRMVQFVCDRAAKLSWPIKLGAAYRLVDGAKKKLELVEAAAS